MLANVFRRRYEGDDLVTAVDSFRATVLGAYARGLSPAKRRRLLAFVLTHLLDGERASSSPASK